MTWIALGAAAIAAAGSVGSAALSKGGAPPPAAPQLPQDQKTASTKSTAADFKLPPNAPMPPQQVQMPGAQPPPMAAQGIPQDAQLADYLKLLHRGEY